MTEQQVERLRIGIIPAVALIGALIAQTATGIWWIASTDRRVQSLEERAAGSASDISTLSDRLSGAVRDVAVAGERLRSIESGVARIERGIDRITGREAE